MEAQVYPPVGAGQLRAGDPALDGLALLSLELTYWPGAEKMFDAYIEGRQINIASEFSLGITNGQPTAELKISAAEIASLLRIGLSRDQYRAELIRIGAHSRVALIKLEDFEQLPDDEIESGLQQSVLVIDLRLPDGYEEWVLESED